MEQLKNEMTIKLMEDFMKELKNLKTMVLVCFAVLIAGNILLNTKINGLVEDNQFKKDQDIRALYEAITNDNVSLWSISYIKDTYSYCEKSELTKECNAISDYLKEIK